VIKNYTISDTYCAAAIVLITGRWPDKFIRVHEEGDRIAINMAWDVMDEETAQKVARKELLVEPIEYGKIHRKLKSAVLQVRDKREVQNE
jgi:hypothetical protein